MKCFRAALSRSWVLSRQLRIFRKIKLKRTKITQGLTSRRSWDFVTKRAIVSLLITIILTTLHFQIGNWKLSGKRRRRNSSSTHWFSKRSSSRSWEMRTRWSMRVGNREILPRRRRSLTRTATCSRWPNTRKKFTINTTLRGRMFLKMSKSIKMRPVSKTWLKESICRASSFRSANMLSIPKLTRILGRIPLYSMLSTLRKLGRCLHLS